MEFSGEVFQATVRFLETHEESLRIKKVIFCLCKRYWENDEAILRHFSLGELLEETIVKIPNFPELEAAIEKLIKSLNNSDFYRKISKIILDRLSLVYNPQELSVSGIPTQPNCQQDNLKSLVDIIVQDLTKHPEKKRIKKLILSSCQSQWEKDSAIIRKHDLRDLILDLYKLNPQKSDLEKSLNIIVKKLNKPEVYSPLSGLIVDRLSVLYETAQKPTASSPIIAKEKSTLELPKIKINSPKPSRSNQTNIKKKLTLSDLPTSPANPKAEEVPVEGSEAPDLIKRKYDIFDLRLEIMQYTNPLRSKMILFSAFNEFWLDSEQDWSVLKKFTLDDLLQQLFEMGKSKSEIQEEFQQVVNFLRDSDSNQQTAQSLFEIIEKLP